MKGLASMTQSTIIACTIIAAIALFIGHGCRIIYGLHANKCQFHPLTVITWIANSGLTIIFLLAANNFAMAIITVLDLALEVIVLVLNTIVLKRSKRHLWRITSANFVCFGLAMLAIVAWRLTNDVNLGTLISFIGSMFGEIPQLRKDYSAPSTDSIIFYIVPLVRYVALIGTLTAINFVGLLSSLGWALTLVVELAWFTYCKRHAQLMRCEAAN